jgi:hypothetical protein
MSEEAYIEGWRTGDAMAEIRAFRTEITLCAVHAAQVCSIITYYMTLLVTIK